MGVRTDEAALLLTGSRGIDPGSFGSLGYIGAPEPLGVVPRAINGGAGSPSSRAFRIEQSEP
ncbi:hypothetical protein R50076_25530 [Gilvimarinus japonicus]